MVRGLGATNKGDGMDELSKLGLKYGTDKIGKHNYLPIYYDLFKDRRNEVKKVLEIGVGEGAGLRMFHDFFPNATIYGAEIDEKRIFKEDRIDVTKCDQSKLKDIENIIGLVLSRDPFQGQIDLIIDDGSHKSSDQIFTCLAVAKLLLGKQYLTYVIEDVSEPEIVDLLKENYSAKLIKCGERYDDNLIIVNF